MQEAKFSITLKFGFKGYDTMLTLRDDESCQNLIDKISTVVIHLGNLGATPDRRWEQNISANNHPQSTPKDATTPECPIHHKAKRGREGLYCPTKLPNGIWCYWTAPD